MTLSNSEFAYKDCFRLFDQCMESARGLRIEYPEERTASYMALRFNKARMLDREKNSRMYSEAEPLYGKSIYDEISIRKREDNGKFYLVLVKTEAMADAVVIEELGEDFNIFEGPKQLPYKVALELLPAPAKPAVEGEEAPKEYGPNVRRI